MSFSPSHIHNYSLSHFGLCDSASVYMITVPHWSPFVPFNLSLPSFLFSLCYYISLTVSPQHSGTLIILQGQLVISGILTSSWVAPSPNPPYLALSLTISHLSPLQLLSSSCPSPSLMSQFHVTAEISYQINSTDGAAALNLSTRHPPLIVPLSCYLCASAIKNRGGIYPHIRSIISYHITLLACLIRATRCCLFGHIFFFFDLI